MRRKGFISYSLWSTLKSNGGRNWGRRYGRMVGLHCSLYNPGPSICPGWHCPCGLSLTTSGIRWWNTPQTVDSLVEAVSQVRFLFLHDFDLCQVNKNKPTDCDCGSVLMNGTCWTWNLSVDRSVAGWVWPHRAFHNSWLTVDSRPISWEPTVGSHFYMRSRLHRLYHARKIAFSSFSPYVSALTFFVPSLL